MVMAGYLHKKLKLPIIILTRLEAKFYKILLVTIRTMLISNFKILKISNKISGRAYKIWQKLVTPAYS